MSKTIEILLFKNRMNAPSINEINNLFGSNFKLKKELTKLTKDGDVDYTSPNGILKYLNFDSMNIRTNKVIISEFLLHPEFLNKYFIIDKINLSLFKKSKYFIKAEEDNSESLVTNSMDTIC